jgi:hypothetical protein
LQEKIFHQKITLGDPRHHITGKRVEGGYRSIFDGKIFFVESILINAIFRAEYEYDTLFIFISSFYAENSKLKMKF